VFTGDQGSGFPREEPIEFGFPVGTGEEGIDGGELGKETPPFVGIDIDSGLEGFVEGTVALTQDLMESVLVGSVPFHQPASGFHQRCQGFSVLSKTDGSQSLRPVKLSFGRRQGIALVGVGFLLDEAEMPTELGVEFLTGDGMVRQFQKKETSSRPIAFSDTRGPGGKELGKIMGGSCRKGESSITIEVGGGVDGDLDIVSGWIDSGCRSIPPRWTNYRSPF